MGNIFSVPHKNIAGKPEKRVNIPVAARSVVCVSVRLGTSINCNLAYRNRRTTWLPLWGSWLPRKGQTERAIHRFLLLLSYCGTLSVSLFGCQLSQRESQGALPYLPAKLQFTGFNQERKLPVLPLWENRHKFRSLICGICFSFSSWSGQRHGTAGRRWPAWQARSG